MRLLGVGAGSQWEVVSQSSVSSVNITEHFLQLTYVQSLGLAGRPCSHRLPFGAFCGLSALCPLGDACVKLDSIRHFKGCR